MEKVYVVKRKVAEENIANLLANGLADVCGFDSLDFEEIDYKDALNTLIAEGNNKPCREDVYARMLFLGKSILLHDSEEDEDEGWHELTLDNILEQDIDFQKLEDNGDFFDNDAILQIACYGEVIYG